MKIKGNETYNSCRRVIQALFCQHLFVSYPSLILHIYMILRQPILKLPYKTTPSNTPLRDVMGMVRIEQFTP